MNLQPCSLATESAEPQSLFRDWIDRQVRRLVAAWIENALRSLLQDHLQAGWHQRVRHRRGYRNGFRPRTLTTILQVCHEQEDHCRQRVLGPVETLVAFSLQVRHGNGAGRALRQELTPIPSPSVSAAVLP
jgi:hypothetical protein